MNLVSDWPIASLADTPKMRSAAGFNVSTIPVSLTVMIPSPAARRIDCVRLVLFAQRIGQLLEFLIRLEQLQTLTFQQLLGLLSGLDVHDRDNVGVLHHWPIYAFLGSSWMMNRAALPS